MLAKPHSAKSSESFAKAIPVPISGLVVTFSSAIENHADAIEALRSIPEIELGESGGSRLAIVVDSEDRERDQEIWITVRELPGVVDLAVAMIMFEEDQPVQPTNQSGTDAHGSQTP